MATKSPALKDCWLRIRTYPGGRYANVWLMHANGAGMESLCFDDVRIEFSTMLAEWLGATSLRIEHEVSQLEFEPIIYRCPNCRPRSRIAEEPARNLFDG